MSPVHLEHASAAALHTLAGAQIGQVAGILADALLLDGAATMPSVAVLSGVGGYALAMLTPGSHAGGMRRFLVLPVITVAVALLVGVPAFSRLVLPSPFDPALAAVLLWVPSTFATGLAYVGAMVGYVAVDRAAGGQSTDSPLGEGRSHRDNPVVGTTGRY
jgi:hypothetical protein